MVIHMSLNTHKYAISLDNAIAEVKSKYQDNNLTGKKIISTVVAVQIVKDLALPTSTVAGVDAYWWSNHHEIVTKQVSAVNEVYPIPVHQVIGLVKQLYVRRYNVAYPNTTDDFCGLLAGAFTDGVEEIVDTTRGLGSVFHNLTVAEILRDAIK